MKKLFDYKKVTLPLVSYRTGIAIVCASAVLGLGACSSAPKGRYAITQDTAPGFNYGDITYDEVIPKSEPHNKWTSRPYHVMGKILSNAKC